MSSFLLKTYHCLLNTYGPQGWWPLLKDNNNHHRNYHPGIYHFPQKPKEIFEICVGAILTQNTNWMGVEKSLWNLKKVKGLTYSGMKKLADTDLLQAIKPSGYFNQKAKKLRILCDNFPKWLKKTPTREELLAIWGIGPETADSILLYAFKVPTFVVDAYTKRILLNLNMIKEQAGYDDVKKLFEQNLPKDLIIFQEYHALLVRHAKDHYSKRPHGANCFLRKAKK
ncbi:MAG: endonuclease III domain-containing protein [Bacteriovoracia bacterium]